MGSSLRRKKAADRPKRAPKSPKRSPKKTPKPRETKPRETKAQKVLRLQRSEAARKGWATRKRAAKAAARKSKASVQRLKPKAAAAKLPKLGYTVLPRKAPLRQTPSPVKPKKAAKKPANTALPKPPKAFKAGQFKEPSKTVFRKGSLPQLPPTSKKPSKKRKGYSTKLSTPAERELRRLLREERRARLAYQEAAERKRKRKRKKRKVPKKPSDKPAVDQKNWEDQLKQSQEELKKAREDLAFEKWVASFVPAEDPEWIKRDGTIALQPSKLRTKKILDQMSLWRDLDEVASSDLAFRELAELMAAQEDCDVREIYAFYKSP